jgi:hypothetical protein
MTASREVSEICRHCGFLTGGVEAGNAVRWTNCTSEKQQQRADGEWVCAVPLPYPRTLTERIREWLRSWSPFR